MSSRIWWSTLILAVLFVSGLSTSLSPSPSSPVAVAQPFMSAPVALHAPHTLGGYRWVSTVPASKVMSGSITIRPGADASNIAGYLRSHGFSIDAPSGAIVWLVTGTAGDFEQTFQTALSFYSDSSGSEIGAFTLPPRSPAGLPILAITPPDGADPMVEALGPHGPASSTSVGSVACPSTASYLLSPHQVQNAYNITPVLNSGDKGIGETIGIVDAYDSAEPPSRIASDLSQFSTCEGLPPANISFDYPVPGGDMNSSYSSGWGLEIGLDTQWAHATAPDARIALVLSPNNAYGLYFGVDWLVATRSADVISLSWGEPESGIYNLGPCSYQCNASSDGSLATLGPVLAQAAAEGITVFVASGDCGANGGTPTFTPWYPASDPHAVGVGGTILKLSPTGGYGSEFAWNGTASYCSNGGGSGGGFSLLPRPPWQDGRPGFSAYTNTTRGVPDVALVAAVPLGMIYNGSAVFVEGTSDAAPQWAGLGALIGDALGGGPPGFLAPTLYSILSSPAYLNSFHQITKGGNGYHTGPYWNAVTGMGTPNFTGLLATLRNRSMTTVAGPGQLLLGAAPLSGESPYPWSPLPVNLSAQPWPGEPIATRYQFYLGDVGPPYGEGNATTTASDSVTAAYQDPGAHVAFAVGYDNNSAVAMSNPLVINVNNSGPLPVDLLVPNATGTIGLPIEFDAVASGGQAPYHFAYFLGDGTYESSWANDGPTFTHAYGANGTYLVTVVANDSSTPQRGGWASACVYIGNTTTPCPALPRTLSVSLVPSNGTLGSGGSNVLTVETTFNGAPIPGATVHFTASQGVFSDPTGTTGVSGVALTNYTAPVVSQTIQYPVYANVSAPGYGNGTGEVLLIVNPSAGPSLLPSISLSVANPLSGSSDGIVISTHVAVTGGIVPNATVALSATVGQVQYSTDRVNSQGFLTASFLAPILPSGSVPSPVSIRATVSFPGYTASITSVSFRVEPGMGGLEISSAVNNTTVPSMTSTGVELAIDNGTGSPPQFGSISAEAYGGAFTYWGNYSAGRVHLYYSAPATIDNITEILYFNVSASQSRAILGSAVQLVNVTWGHGPVLISVSPGTVGPRFHGNLTVHIRAALTGLPLYGALVIVSVLPGDGVVDPNAGFTGTFGRVAIGYVAPNFTGTILLNITAIGFVYKYTVQLLPLELALPPPPPNLPNEPLVTGPTSALYLVAAIGVSSLVAWTYAWAERRSRLQRTAPQPPNGP